MAGKKAARKLKGIQNVDVRGKIVLMRIDINTPIDPEKGVFLNEFRLKRNVDAINELLDKQCKLVLLAHQGDPGEGPAFTSLREHAKRLSKLCNRQIRFTTDIFGDTAVRAIRRLKTGKCLLLENVRFYSEEKIDRPFHEHAKNNLVKTLSKETDLYVNNAFSAIHRNHSSLTGFPMVLPAYAGRLLEQEVNSFLNTLNSKEKQNILILGGSKIRPKMELLQKACGKFGRVLTGGLVANLLLAASGRDIKQQNVKILEREGLLELMGAAKKLIETHGNRIELPEDFVTEGTKIMDIGPNTVKRYKSIIRSAERIIFNGPMGVIEKPKYVKGTEEIARAIAESKGYKLICGGHTPVIFEKLGLLASIDHISTGGGAALHFIGGNPLPGLYALKKGQAKFRGDAKNG